MLCLRQYELHYFIPLPDEFGIDMGRDNLPLLHFKIGGPPRRDTTQASAGCADLRSLLCLGTPCGNSFGGSCGGGRGGTGGAVILQLFDGRRSRYI